MRSTASSLRLAGAAVLLFASIAPALAADTTERAQSDSAATDSGAAPAAAEPAAKPAKEKKVCRTETASESRLGAKRICMTAAEWRAREG
ncbi:MAG TPA: hypothetical protein VIT45_08415 [Allosphingosinicella sp.]